MRDCRKEASTCRAALRVFPCSSFFTTTPLAPWRPCAAGRLFDGRTVRCFFVTEENFNALVKDSADAAAADAAAGASGAGAGEEGEGAGASGEGGGAAAGEAGGAAGEAGQGGGGGEKEERGTAGGGDTTAADEAAAGNDDNNS